MEEAVDARSARRYGIGIRLVLYPLALALIVVAWRHYHGPEKHFKVVEFPRWVGTTSEGMPVSGRITDEGRAVTFAIPISEHCSDGSEFVFDWYPGLQRWVQRGSDLYGSSSGSNVDSRGFPATYYNQIKARIDARPRGTVTGWTRVETPGGSVNCASGPVSFTLRRER